MATYVLVHGAYHGGWCWRDVAKRLRTAGHDVFTPTLTGLGERSHLLSSAVDLSMHVTDIVNVLEWEDLQDVILVGHSYGGMVVTGVAGRAAHRIRDIIYLDAIVPTNGQSTLDVQPPGRREWIVDRARAAGGLAGGPIDPEAYGVTEPAAKAWVTAKCTPQPFSTLSQKISISGQPADQIGKHLYILCTNPALPYMRQFYETALTTPGWDAVEIATGHDAMVTEPEKLTQAFLARS